MNARATSILAEALRLAQANLLRDDGKVVAHRLPRAASSDVALARV
jgi:hypothetical protein